MSKQVTIIDYGLGNLFSVSKAFEAVGAKVNITSDATAIQDADHLVLPGVGAFRQGMAELESKGLIDPIKAYVASKKPFLGICLGMQMLLETGEENGSHKGLGVIPGKVILIPDNIGIKIPHIGWSKISPVRQSWEGGILKDIVSENSFYFVHSYFADCPEAHILAAVEYGGHKITAAIKRNNVYGCQFHPEKSGEAGLKICKNFMEL